MPTSYSYIPLLLVMMVHIITISTTWAQVTSPDAFVNAGSLGGIQGQISTTLGSSPRSYAQFLGIRYASEPTRFMPSELFRGPQNNTGPVFNANRFGSECPQSNSQGVSTGSPDCLFLNVYSPQVTNSSVKYPIIVFIHGAAFVSGNANMYNGARLLNKDVVLISFNYRLGVFGFYNLETQTAPGNAALYDALIVLQWVQEYAHYFNGDATQVTLGGQSSGSATVSHLLASPLSRGLFHRVIAASGSALDVWATSANPLTASLQVALYAGCANESSFVNLNKTLVMDCMLNRTQAQLTQAQNMYQFLDMASGSIGFAAVSPSVQMESLLPPGFPRIVPAHPLQVLESGMQNNVSLMMGVTKDDGGFALRLVLNGYINPNGLINDTEFMKEKLVPTIFQATGISDKIATTIASTFSNIYMEEVAGQSGDFHAMVPSLMDMLGVLFFKSAAYQSARYHSKMAKDTYYYSFDYEGNYTRHPPNAGFPGGVAHADDLQYVFQLTGDLNEKDQAMSDMMVDYWVNFVQTGNPNTYQDGSSSTLPNWPALENPANHYLVIDSNTASSTNYPQSWVIENRKEEIVCQNSASPNKLFNILIVPLMLMCTLMGQLL